jgi:hypothetical protein
MPGDQDIPSPYWVMDQQIDLAAPPEEVWPWLAQMGDGRAGWYSYDWIDNWGRPSFRHIEPRLQKLNRDQKISIFTLTDFLKPHYLVLTYSGNANMTWQLEPTPQGCHLTTRVRVRGPHWLLSLTLGPGHYLMQRKQFIELKKRVERTKSPLLKTKESP